MPVWLADVMCSPPFPLPPPPPPPQTSTPSKMTALAWRGCTGVWTIRGQCPTETYPSSRPLPLCGCGSASRPHPCMGVAQPLCQSLTSAQYTFVRDMKVLELSGVKTYVVLAKSQPFSGVPEKEGVIRVTDFQQACVMQSDGKVGSKGICLRMFV